MQLPQEVCHPLTPLPGFIKLKNQFRHHSQDMFLGQFLFDESRGFLQSLLYKRQFYFLAAGKIENFGPAQIIADFHAGDSNILEPGITAFVQQDQGNLFPQHFPDPVPSFEISKHF
ncbi:MAG TPA: hypothetical protein VLR91_02045 [Thermodesulfobacteriota bacterium]|nr:hypothetical protein [Thermodesulfobacteriota bacterium]